PKPKLGKTKRGWVWVEQVEKKKKFAGGVGWQNWGKRKGLGLGGTDGEEEEICSYKIGENKKGLEKKKKFAGGNKEKRRRNLQVGTKRKEEEICKWGWIEKLGKVKRGWFWLEQEGDEEEEKKTQGAMRDGKERAEEAKLPD
ncbi:hypothetical protein DVH24_041690, partial [Malus domestica]